MWPPLPAYAELHCLSSFSFQRGASQPEELVARAAALGYTALAITDECSVAGLVRAHVEAKKCGLQLLPGAEFRVQGELPRCDADRVIPLSVAEALGRQGRDTPPLPGIQTHAGTTLVVLPHNLEGWGNLCEFITAARAKAVKGDYQVTWAGSDFASLQDCEVLLVPPRGMVFEALWGVCHHARGLFGSRLWLTLELLHGLDDDLWQHTLGQISMHSGVPLVAAGNVHMHVRSRKPLQDVITAVRPAGSRMRFRSATQRRGASARATAAGWHLCAAVAAGDMSGGGTVYFQPGRTALPVPARDGAAGPDRGADAAPVHLRGHEPAVSAGYSGTGAGTGRT